MPVMSGWAVAREIKNRSPEIPVYMLTGWADEIGLDDPRREMVTDILPKPVQVERLSAILAG